MCFCFCFLLPVLFLCKFLVCTLIMFMFTRSALILQCFSKHSNFRTPLNISFIFIFLNPIYITITKLWNFMHLKLSFLFHFRKNLILAETGKRLQNLISTIFKITLLVEYRSFVNECIGLCRRGGALRVWIVKKKYLSVIAL